MVFYALNACLYEVFHGIFFPGLLSDKRAQSMLGSNHLFHTHQVIVRQYWSHDKLCCLAPVLGRLFFLLGEYVELFHNLRQISLHGLSLCQLRILFALTVRLFSFCEYLRKFLTWPAGEQENLVGQDLFFINQLRREVIEHSDDVLGFLFPSLTVLLENYFLQKYLWFQDRFWSVLLSFLISISFSFQYSMQCIFLELLQAGKHVASDLTGRFGFLSVLSLWVDLFLNSLGFVTSHVK